MAYLDHIGIAVADLPALKRLFSLLALEVSGTEPVPDQGVTTHFLPMPAGAQPAQLELLEVTDPEGTVARFVQKRGPGIHHLSFRVRAGELEPLCARLRAGGYRLVYDAPRSGAHGMRINFIHPASAGGILIEVMEPADADPPHTGR
jgi:methylmalonyl-CoA/ethylmalonyl-CoA epimerase